MPLALRVDVQSCGITCEMLLCNSLYLKKTLSFPFLLTRLLLIYSLPNSIKPNSAPAQENIDPWVCTKLWPKFQPN